MTDRGRAQTVLGPVDPADLGATLMHEHLLCDVTPPEMARAGGAEVEITLENVFEVRYHWSRHLGNHRLVDEATAIREIARLAEAGGRTLVEVTSGGLGRDPDGLRRIAAASGVNVIMGCGYYTEPYLTGEVRSRSATVIAEEIVRDLMEGVGASGVKAGIIGEIGCSWPWTDVERRVMAGAVEAQRATGAALSVHPGRDPCAPLEIVRFVEAHGGDPSRTIIGHLDRTLSGREDLVALARTGCVLEWDFFGIESSYYPFGDIDLPNDGRRLDLIREVLDAGFGSQVVVGHDICTKTRLVAYGGHGYRHLLAHVVPVMHRKGFGREEIDAILVATPRRLLTRP